MNLKINDFVTYLSNFQVIELILRWYIDGLKIAESGSRALAAGILQHKSAMMGLGKNDLRLIRLMEPLVFIIFGKRNG